MTLYKYRSFSNLQFLLDVFVNKRLYASHFKKLNDPMEGRYIYAQGTLTDDQIEAIRGSKEAHNVLSLSATHTNLLMWSYYGDGHTGLAIGVDVTDSDAVVKPVKYVNTLRLKELGQKKLSPDKLAQLVLCKKLSVWAHEKEHRVFKRGSNFVAVKVKEVYFGMSADDEKVQLVTSIAETFCPGVRMKRLTRRDLDSGSSPS